MTMPKIMHASESANADYNISKMLDQPGGVEKIALEKLPPFIREVRDYEGFTRQILFTHNVTGQDMQIIDGEPYVYYPKDFDSHAAFYADDGQVPRLAVEGEGVNVGIVTIAADDITIHLKRLMYQKYDYLERTKEKSGQAIAEAEDTRLLNLVETLLQGSGTASAPAHQDQIVTTANTTLAKADLVSLKQKIDQHDIPVGAFLMKQDRISDMLGWQSGQEIDQLTQREMIESGVRYVIWGIKIITSRVVRSDVVYAFAEPEYVGRLPILKDLTIKLTETPNKLEQGLFLYEFIGFYLASHKAIAKLKLGYTSGSMIDIIDTTNGTSTEGTPVDDLGGR